MRTVLSLAVLLTASACFAEGFMVLPELPVFRFPKDDGTNSLVWVSQAADGRIQTERVQRFLTIENPAYVQAAKIASVSLLSTNETQDAWVVSFKVVQTSGAISTNFARYPKAPELLVRQNLENQRKRLEGYAVKMGVVVPKGTSTNTAAAVAELTGRIRAHQEAQKKPGFARLADLTASDTVKGAGKANGKIRIEPATASEVEGLIASAEAEKELNPKARDLRWSEADRKATVLKITTMDDSLKTTDVRFVRKVSTAKNTNCLRRERVGTTLVCYFDGGRITTNALRSVRGAPIENPYVSKFDAAERRKAKEEGDKESSDNGKAAATGAAGVIAGAAGAAALKKRK